VAFQLFNWSLMETVNATFPSPDSRKPLKRASVSLVPTRARIIAFAIMIRKFSRPALPNELSARIADIHVGRNFCFESYRMARTRIPK